MRNGKLKLYDKHPFLQNRNTVRLIDLQAWSGGSVTQLRTASIGEEGELKKYDGSKECHFTERVLD